MKKYFFVASAMMIGAATLYAQGKTTKEVEIAFNSRFPNAVKVKWEKENDQEYEANFILNGINYSANFSNNGAWLETESPMAFEKLPLKVQTNFKREHKDLKIKAVDKIEASNGEVQYEIEARKGLTTIDYVYNSEGKLIK